MLEAEAARGPLVVIIDDMHWADDTTLRKALAKGGGAGSFACCARRRETRPHRSRRFG
jgi:hypothetical protein